VVWYKIAGGYTPLDHQAFTVLGISIFAVGLFAWLRLVNGNIRAGRFLLSAQMVAVLTESVLSFTGGGR
jgi:hypothetical protein